MGEVTIIYHANPEAKPAPGETEKSRSADAATKKRRAFPRRAQVPHVAAPSSLSITHTRGEHRPRLNAHIQSPSTTQRNARLFRRRAQSGGERARVRGLSDITCRQTRPRGPPRELEHVTTRRRGEHVRGHGGGCRHDPPALPPVTHHPRVVCGLQAQSYFVVIPSKIRGWSSAKANPRNAIIRFSEELANLQFDLLANLFTIRNLLAPDLDVGCSSSSWQPPGRRITRRAVGQAATGARAVAVLPVCTTLALTPAGLLSRLCCVMAAILLARCGVSTSFRTLSWRTPTNGTSSTVCTATSLSVCT